MREYTLSLLVAAALTYLVMPLVREAALRSRAVAGVRDRDVHDHAIPRWGGLGMFAGLVAGMVLASKLPPAGRGPALGGHDHRAAGPGR